MGVEEAYKWLVEKLAAGVNDPWTFLHEAQETEAKAKEEAKVKGKEQQVIIGNLKEKCQQAEQGCSQLAKEVAELQTVRSRGAEDSCE